MDEDEDDGGLAVNAALPRAVGPERPPDMRQYGNFGNDTWGFGALQYNSADTDAEMLLHNVGNHHDHERDAYEDDDGDAGSTTAERDYDNDIYFQEENDDDDRMPGLINSSPVPDHEYWNETTGSFTLGQTDAFDEYQGDHTLYSDTHGGRNEDLQVPDAGRIEAGEDEEDDPPVTDIQLDDREEEERNDGIGMGTGVD